MRRVMVSEHQRSDDGKWEVVEKGEAFFHQFGLGYEEYDMGPGNYSVAIVEWPGGQVESVPVDLIRFLD